LSLGATVWRRSRRSTLLPSAVRCSHAAHLRKGLRSLRNAFREAIQRASHAVDTRTCGPQACARHTRSNLALRAHAIIPREIACIKWTFREHCAHDYLSTRPPRVRRRLRRCTSADWSYVARTRRLRWRRRDGGVSKWTHCATTTHKHTHARPAALSDNSIMRIGL
jgi:hypothetical protein